MPSGERHLKLELVLWPAFGAGYFWLDPEPARLGAFLAAYLVSSLFLSPDLDLRHNSARRRWGRLGFLWIPYSKLFKHRGLSHSLTWGMITRLAYLSLLAGLGVGGAVAAGMSLPPARWAPDWPLIGAALAGLYVPNVLHVLYDRWDTRRRRRRRARVVR